MATNLDLDDKLIEEAVKLSGAKTKKEAVTLALREYIRRNQLKGFLALKGKVKFDPSYDYKAARKKR